MFQQHRFCIVNLTFLYDEHSFVDVAGQGSQTLITVRAYRREGWGFAVRRFLTDKPSPQPLVIIYSQGLPLEGVDWGHARRPSVLTLFAVNPWWYVQPCLPRVKHDRAKQDNAACSTRQQPASSPPVAALILPLSGNCTPIFSQFSIFFLPGGGRGKIWFVGAEIAEWYGAWAVVYGPLGSWAAQTKQTVGTGCRCEQLTDS